MAPPIGVIKRQRRAELERIVRVGWNDSIYLGVDTMGRSIVKAAEQATDATARQVLALAEVFRRGIDPAARLEMFDALGKRGQQAVLGSYDATRRGPKGYRQTANRANNIRYAGGRLRGALAAGDFYEAAPDGLRFINITTLDRTAKQWGRLAFGALPAGRGSQRQFAVRWSNLVVASLGLAEPPRDAFGIPRGYWWNGEVVPPGPPGTAEFYPFGEGPRPRLRSRSGGVRTTPRGGMHPTRGVAARNFFDAGYARIAEDYPKALEGLLRNLQNRGSLQRVEHVTGRVTVRPVSSFVLTISRY
jgi:hypothetical protein